jgi:Icc-related predicted phosphoesterase
MNLFLIAGRLDGRSEALANLQTVVQERRPDAVLFAGGILANSSTVHAERLKAWEGFFEGLGRLGVFTAMIPGSADVPLREFLRLAGDAEVEYPDLHTAHATVFEEDHVAVCGLGGELTETEDCTEGRLSYSRPSAEYFLRTLWRSEQPHTILLLSVAPPGPLGGEAGNPICGDFIDSFHPKLCVAADTTPRRGIQRIAQTLVVNPGRLADGSLAWLDLNQSKDEQVEFLSLG